MSRKNIIFITKYLAPLIGFFIIETLSHGNEVIPLLYILIYTYYLFRTSIKIKPEIILFCVGIFLGTIIELGMTQISRAQFWENTFLTIPLWLPLAWGVGAVVFLG
jgi:hypothetical protein